MKKKILALVIMGMAVCMTAHADFNLSVTPVEGGSSLRFGRVSSSEEVTREVRVRVSSTTGAKYQLRQGLVERIVDERGNPLDSEAVTFYTLRGSNMRGTLYQDMQANLGTLDQVIYTSNDAGDDDSLVIAYKVNGSKLNLSGSLTGRLSYSLIPQGAGTQQQVFLNIYIDAQGGFSVSVEPSTGERALRLSTDEKDSTAEVALVLNGVLSNEYTITQSPQDGLRNESGDLLPDGVVKFSVYAQSGTSQVTSLTELSRKDEKIYSANANIGSDKVVIKFVIDQEAAAKLNSGVYRGVFAYNVESAGAIVTRVPLEVIVDIKKVFELELLTEGTNKVLFEDVGVNSPVVEKKIMIRIKTNVNKPYTVVRKVNSPLTNDKGETIPMENFTMRQVLPEGGNGVVAYTTATALKLGDTQIFSSDAKGSPAEFEVIYSITPLSHYKAGNYYFDISYALMEK